MAFIATVSPRAATGETADVYRHMREMARSPIVAQVVQLFSLRPASMRWMIRNWELGLWVGDGPRAARELVAAMISRLNECHY